MRKGKILIPKGQKEIKSVTFVICLRTIWYNKEGVNFRDSGSKFERNIAKLQICHTLPEFRVGTSSWRPKILLVAAKDFYLDQNMIPLTPLSQPSFFLVPSVPQRIKISWYTPARQQALGCDFFVPTANLLIHGRTLANKFFKLCLCVFM